MADAKSLTITTPSDREVVITRSFDAPRELVFDAWTKPELVRQWLWGPDHWPLAHVAIDLRVGGELRYEWRHADGRTMGLTGVYREIDPPRRIVHTELFDDDWTGGETLITTDFTEAAGRTTVAMTIRYSSREARDNAMKTGMTEGMSLCYQRLDELLAGMSGNHGASS